MGISAGRLTETTLNPLAENEAIERASRLSAWAFASRERVGLAGGIEVTARAADSGGDPDLPPAEESAPGGPRFSLATKIPALHLPRISRAARSSQPLLDSITG
jgi:hypothetical protein